jgi:hypothetical protein
MKFRIQTTAKSIQIPFSKEIQNSDLLFDANLFFQAIRCNKELVSPISSNSKVPKISSEFLNKFYP